MNGYAYLLHTHILLAIDIMHKKVYTNKYLNPPVNAGVLKPSYEDMFYIYTYLNPPVNAGVLKNYLSTQCNCMNLNPRVNAGVLKLLPLSKVKSIYLNPPVNAGVLKPTIVPTVVYF